MTGPSTLCNRHPGSTAQPVCYLILVLGPRVETINKVRGGSYHLFFQELCEQIDVFKKVYANIC